MRKQGRPSQTYDPETAGTVKKMSQFGVRQEDLAAYLGMAQNTMLKLYQKEIEAGRILANAKIAETLFKKAAAGDTTAAIFWLKTRAGWKETSKVEHSGGISWEEAIRKARGGNGNEAD